MTHEKNMTLHQQYGMVQLQTILRLFLDYGIDFQVETEEKAGNIYKWIKTEYALKVNNILSCRFCVMLRPAKNVELTPESENRFRIYDVGVDGGVEEVSLFDGVNFLFEAVIQ